VRRTHDVRETVEDLLAEQQRNCARRLTYTAHLAPETRVTSLVRHTLIRRLGWLLAAAGLGSMLGVSLDSIATGTAFGVVLGILFGSLLTAS